jgi:biopolymer transport protein ExbD
MAQMENNRSTAVAKHNGRATRKSLFVDLTPMVDLAFLLISFFMLTTVLQENTAMELRMPENTGPQTPIAESRTITLIAAADNQLYYYNGIQSADLILTNYTHAGIRELLYNRIHAQRKVDPQNGLICIIKLTDEADYNDMVSLLDEMEITAVPTYAIQDLTVAEQNQLDKLQKNK